jgi:hypothetical protein
MYRALSQLAMVETPDNITLPGLAGNGRVSRSIQHGPGVAKVNFLAK